MNRVCIVETCSTIILSNKKYCVICKKKRQRALFFSRVLRKKVKKLSEDVYQYIIEIKHLDNNLMLKAIHLKDPTKVITYLINEHDEIDIAILLKGFYKAIKVIDTKASIHKVNL